MTQAIPIARDCAATCFTHWTGYAVSARRSTTRTGRITVALLSALTLMSAFADGTALVLGARPAALVVAPLAL